MSPVFIFFRLSCFIFLAQFPHSVLSEEVLVGGTGSVLAAMQKLAYAYSLRQQQVSVRILPNLGSKGAMRGIAAGKLDIALISRPLTEAESNAGLVSQFFARSPFVLVSSIEKNNGRISSSKLAEIYRGEQRRWPDGSLIRLVLRPLTDGDSQLLMRHSPELGEALRIASAREGLVTAINDQDAANALESLPGSLGVSTLSLVLGEKRKLHLLSLDGQRALINGVPNPDYPIQKQLFLVVRTHASPATNNFLRFATSEEAKKLLEHEGYVFSK